MTNLHRYVRPYRTPSLHRLRIYRPIPLLIFAAASLLLSAVLTHAQDVRDSVFSRKADCTLVGPFAGSYEKGWTVEYNPDNTAWLVHGPHYRAQLQLMARGYRVGTGEYHGAAWYATFEQTDQLRQLRITAYPANGSESYLVDLLTQTAFEPVTCRNAVTGQKLQAALPLLERLITNALDQGQIPGLSVGIVYQGQVAYLKSFGVREAGQPELVNPDTVFQLASLSKPLSSTIISSLVTDGTVKWDDRVINHDPEFALSDSTITSKVTIGDMFAHRSGLPGSAGNDLESVGYQQPTILYRLRFVPPAYPFRKGWGYSNFGLTEGAVAAAKAAGEEWAGLARRQLFEPLRMTQTSMRYADFTARANRAHLHILINNQWTPALTRDADAQAPGGGASSSVRDMVHWLILELADGQYEGRQLIRKDALEIARTPQAIRTGSNAETELDNYYGFGWGLDYLQDGVLSVSHSGIFTAGALNHAALLPSQGLGIVVLGNAFPTGVPEAVASSLMDLARYGRLTQDWFAVWKHRYDAVTMADQAKIAKYSKPPVPNRPSLNLADYAGTYRNDYVGRVKIAVDNGSLLLTRGVRQAPLPLRHWDGNTFLSYPFPDTPGLPALVEFKVDAGGGPSRIQLEEFAGNGEGTDSVTRTE
jgi:CubicO group peptidase (beta-lactamase class C family)